MSVLVLGAQRHGKLDEATARVVAAACQLDHNVDLLLMGNDLVTASAEAATLAGVQRVLVAEAPHLEHLVAEDATAVVLTIIDNYTHVLAAADTTGRNILPRVAARKDVAPISDIVAAESADTFIRPIYAGSALATVRTASPLKVLTVRTTAFDPVSAQGTAAPVESIDAPAATIQVQFVAEQRDDSERPDLASARVVISGGRGIGSGENFTLIERVATKLNAAVGASRAAVDAGFVSNDLQVGQTGKVVAPELYIAVGISGAIQHLAGMQNSKTIVAINQDPDAPIFQVADYGLVGDLFEILPELERKL